MERPAMLTTDLGTRPLKGLFTFRNDLLRPTDKIVGEVRFVGLQHIESGTGRRIGEDLVLAEQLTGRKFRFSPGDIVYGYLRPYLNKVWIADCEGLCSVDQYVLQPDNSQVDTRYLAHAMRSPLFLTQSEQLTGILTLPRLRSGLLESIEIPVPPLDEQRRIVARIEEFAWRVTTAQGLRNESAMSVENLMPEARWQAFEELAQNEHERLPLSEVTAYLGRGRSTVQGTSTVRLLKTRHVYPDGLRSFEDCCLSEEEAAKVQVERFLQPGDVLICSSAAGCLGRPGYFAGYVYPCTTDTHVAIARGDPARLDPRFLFHYVQSPQGQYELLSREQGGKWQEEKVGFRLTELNLADLRTVPVPLPPLDEQRRIAAHLDALQAKADAIRAAQLATQRELAALMPAVLDRAFRGEL